MDEDWRHDGIQWAEEERKKDLKRQPYLRFLRRLLGIPQPRITYDQAIEIVYAHFYGEKAPDDDSPRVPMFAHSDITSYCVEVAFRGFGGHHSAWVDMADGHLSSVLIDSM